MIFALVSSVFIKIYTAVETILSKNRIIICFLAINYTIYRHETFTIPVCTPSGEDRIRATKMA